ncbi:MAG: Bax inhibitor-1/YccA family protein [Candidatus Izemoplasmataceae bacterium]
MSRMQKNITGAQSQAYQASYAGVVMKTTLLFGLLALSGVYTGYQLITTGQIQGGIWTLLGAMIGAFISVIIASLKPNLAPFFSVVYTLLEGVVLGSISAIYTIVYGDMIVPTALVSTGGVFLAMLLLYKSGAITVGPMFRRVLFTMLLGILLTYLFMFIAGFFGFFETALGMDIYLLVVILSAGVASFFLLIDFDNIKQLVDAGADRQYEWILSLSLVVTVVWLYIELLKLLAILRER